MRSGRSGITLIDMVMTVAVIGVVAVAMVPSMTPDAHLRLQSASIVLTSDFEYAQSASVSSPEDPTVVRLLDDGTGYFLALKSDPDTPIELPDGSGEPFEMVYGAGRGAQFEGVFVLLGQDDPTTIEFDAFGRIEGLADAAVELRNLSGGILVRVTAATGSVSVEPAKD